jgi:GT2 family glycosyltransferase
MDINISVVIPTYRRPALLKNCLDALRHQTLDRNNFEIIVVSDGPDAVTEELVNKMRGVLPALRFISLPVKKGPAAARNLGWKHATAQLIAFTDDDCLPDKNWLQAAWQQYQHENEIVFSGKLIVPLSKSPTDHELNTANLETAEFITANCFCTKKALEAAGGFDERYRLAWREDSDLQFRFLKLGIPVIKIYEAKVIHPVRQAPWGFSIREQKKGLYNALLYKKFPDLYRQRIQPAPPWNYYIMIVSLVVAFIFLLKENTIMALSAFLIWLVLMIAFISKRLTKTAHSLSHVAEMIVTSLVIPFLSVYWQIYGAVKFRVWFL